MAFQWTNKVNGDYIDAKDVNDLASGIFENEKAIEETKTVAEDALITARDISYTAEIAANKVTFIGESPDDEHYPTAKAVSDFVVAVAGKTIANDWKGVQTLVREGLAPKVFAIGDQLVCNHETYGKLVWDIIGFDHDVPADGERTHSMTVQLHDILQFNLAYDAIEALSFCETGLSEGTYNFALTPGYDVEHGGGKTYYFTLTKPVPAGGCLVLSWGNNQDAKDGKISTYSSLTSTTVIETVAVAEGIEGTMLTHTNHTHRARYGYNRWSQSALRQWMNSEKASGDWWTPQNTFDRPVNYATTRAGFLNGLDEDFLSVLGKVTKRNALNTVTDGGGYDETDDLMFLISKGEVYGGDENGINEGAPYAYYKDFSSLSVPSTSADANRIKYKDGAGAIWFLRSCSAGTGNSVRRALPEGQLLDTLAYYSYGIAPACNII